MDINNILKTESAKKNFLKGLIRVAKSDGENDERELIFYQQAALSMGLSADTVSELEMVWKEDEKIELFFEKSEEKMFFFVQAIQLCWIDTDYSKEERIEIAQIAEELNISENAIKQVEEWVSEGIQWNQRGDSLLELI